MKKLFSKINLIRIAMAVMLIGCVLALLPHADRQSYSYELNQPWKYPLLTAPFDMPVMRDSTSLTFLRDSVDKHFVPFVKRDAATESSVIERYRAGTAGINDHDRSIGEQLLRHVYKAGVLEPGIYANIHNYTGSRVRMSETEQEDDAVSDIDASSMYSPAKAFEYIDSVYTSRYHGLPNAGMPAEMAATLNQCIVPNMVLDSALDNKYRRQEYFNVTGAQGIIKKGQRIVDRGEIITPQIYTNLNTFQELLSRSSQTIDQATYFYLGQIVYLLVCVSLLYLFLAVYRPHFYADTRKMMFLMIFISFFTALTIILFENITNGIYLVPFAALPVVILIFFDSRTAIFSLLTTVLICALVATYPFEFIVMELCVGLVATLSIHQLTRRSQLLRTAILSLCTYTVAYFAMSLITNGNLDHFTWHIVGLFAINSVVLSFAYILIVIIEKVFGFTSQVTLVELSDINNPLLRRLAEDAPGTFQHSMQVSTLASEAALAIHANVQLVRTGALYHDIGKLESPIFFTENQHGVNPHAGLDPETSARKIIRHVTYGAQLAKQHKLPQVIADFILEHHGRGLTKYFYNTAVNENPDVAVDKEKFRYPGPNPQSKETAILMMADAVEAASRSLKDYSPEAIDRLVDKIIDSQVADGLLAESPLSFRELGVVKDTFKKRLATIYHSRVAYPELRRPEAPADKHPGPAETDPAENSLTK